MKTQNTRAKTVSKAVLTSTVIASGTWMMQSPAFAAEADNLSGISEQEA